MECHHIIYMHKFKLQYCSILLFFLLLLGGMNSTGLIQKQFPHNIEEIEISNYDDEFYFVQITDTHVMHKLFDSTEVSKKRLRSLLDQVCFFEKKPAFIVITGDLTEWGGNKISGALNCLAFISCFYTKNSSLYADIEYSIPIFTTPGNHEYCYNRNLTNYYRFINPFDRYIVKYQNVTLFFMNSGPNEYKDQYHWIKQINGAGLYDDDIKWLERTLETCNTPIKIVLMHHPAVNVRDSSNTMWDVLTRNRVTFISLCEQYDVEVVLAGHTHTERVFDGNETFYPVNTSLNCSMRPTLFVQTDDCKQSVHYRNMSINGMDVWLEPCVEVNFGDIDVGVPITFQQFFMERR